MQHYSKFSFLLLFILLSTLNSQAQYDASATLSLGMGHGYTALSQSVMSNAFNNSNGKATAKSNNTDYIYLGFSDYRGFEDKILNSLLAKDKKSDKGKIRSFLSSTRTMYHFMMRSRELGFKDTYISDIIATGIAWNWEMYHETKTDKQKVLNLRNAIKNNLAKDGVKKQISKLSADDKRNWILSFMYNNSMIAQIIKQSGKLSAEQKQQLVTTAQQAGVPDIAAVSL
ncbi:hypothetical protein QWY86_00930 [Pedobacter aquatilis]|uniref:hypothetical protein n=1 Tax=Pedobacter aquatilis TaxID=351343 RepID=UPI0025B5C813|nr:hypothetical protein [Pedobacter aquatilis]MDN3585212.1 hypothetical protein [Pedobacter aquatilis]